MKKAEFLSNNLGKISEKEEKFRFCLNSPKGNGMIHKREHRK